MTKLSPALTRDLLAFAEELAMAARAETLALFRNIHDVDNKLAATGEFDPVTAADKNAEKLLRRMIEARYPDHDIQGEEFGATDKGSDFCWVLDPIDGTRAFIAGLPSWGTLIALTYQGAPYLGVIDQPALNECYVGDGTISRLNGTIIKAQPCANLSQAITSTTDPYLFAGSAYEAFAKVRETCKLVRYGLDCYAYAILSAGHINMVVESGLATHDRMALIPVLRGAGALALDWRGRPAGPSDELLALSDPRLQDQVLPLLESAAQP